MAYIYDITTEPLVSRLASRDLGQARLREIQGQLTDAAEAIAMAKKHFSEDLDDVGDQAARVNAAHDQLEKMNSAFQESMNEWLRIEVMLSGINATKSLSSSHARSEDLTLEELKSDQMRVKRLDDEYSARSQELQTSIDDLLPETRYEKFQTSAAFAKFWTAIQRVSNPAAEVLVSDLGMFYGDDLLLENTKENLKDPLTHKYLEDPVRGPCGHYYSLQSITVWLSGDNSSCPVSACNKRITMSSLTEAPDVLVKIKRAKEREERERVAHAQTLAEV